MKERENAKKRAITDLNAPHGSPDIPFQSQEFGQDGYHHFVGFQPHFHLNMTSQTQDIEKMKVQYSGVFCLICLKSCRLSEMNKRILLVFKFRCYDNKNQNDCLLLKNKRFIV